MIGFWRDTHLRIVGEAVKQLQILFLTTWDFVTDNRHINNHMNLFPQV